jgi:hypothetical protein
VAPFTYILILMIATSQPIIIPGTFPDGASCMEAGTQAIKHGTGTHLPEGSLDVYFTCVPKGFSKE